MGSERPTPAWTRVDSALLALCVGTLALLPFTAHYWPGQDDPNHLAIAHILGHHADPGAPYPRFFTVHSLVKPYGLYYGLLVGLARFVTLVTADKLLVVAVIVGLPLSTLFLLRRIVPQRARAVFLVVPFVTSWGMMAGFVAFHLAMIPAFLFLGIVWTGGDLRWRRVTLGAALLLLCAALHPIVAILAGLSLVSLEADQIASARTWVKWTSVGLPAALFLVGVWSLGAGHAVAARATAAPAADPSILYSRIDLVLLRFPRRALVGLSPLEAPFRVASFFLLVAGGGFAVLRSSLRDAREKAIARWWLALLLSYVGLPSVLFGWNLCGLHESVFLLFASACVGWIPARLPRHAVGGVTLVLVLGLTVVQRHAIVKLDRRVTTIIDVGSHAARGSTLLPLLFDTRGDAFNTRPLLHSWGHLVIDRDLVTPAVFAAGRNAIGGEPFRVLSFVQPFTPDFLPTLDEEPNVGRADCEGNTFCELERNHRSCTALAVAEAYDYVLVESAPPAFAALLLQHFELVARKDDVLLLHSPTTRPRRFQPSACMLPL